MTSHEKSSLLKTALILLVFSVSVLLGPASAVMASFLTYQRDYAYQASEADSKLSCRTIALEQVKRLLLEELGTYMESQTEVKNYQVSRDQIISITAGIVRAEVLNEKWDGKTYVIIAKITADPHQVSKAIDELRKEKQGLIELEESRKKSEELLKEIDKLRAELKSSKGGQRIQDQKDYTAAVKKLGAADWFREGYALAESRKYREAISFYDKAIDADPNYANAYSVRGFAYYKIKDYQQSLKDVNRALELKPEYPAALASRAQTLVAMKKYERALTDINRAIELNPDFTRAYNIRAFIYLNLKNNLKALEDSNKAIELNPNFSYAYSTRASTHRNMKRYEEAFKDYQKSIEMDPGNPDPYQGRSLAYFQLMKYDEAMRDLNKALELDSDRAFALYRRGLVYYQLNDYEGAVRDFSKAIELEEDYADAYFQRSLCYKRIGKAEESANDMKKAAQLGHPRAQRVIREKGQ
jgi:tetratricopeptide (TPR) repeat protein